MNKELHQAAVDALQALIVDVMASTAKDKFVRTTRLCTLAMRLQREGASGVDEFVKNRQGGLLYNGPNIIPPMQIDNGYMDPVPFNNGFDQGDTGEIERNKMLSTAQLTSLLKDQVASQISAADAREVEGLSVELDNLINTRSKLEERGKAKFGGAYVESKDEVEFKIAEEDEAVWRSVQQRIIYITKLLKEKTDVAIAHANNSGVVRPELVRRHQALDNGHEDAGDSGTPNADGGAGTGAVEEESVESGMATGPVGHGGELPSLDRHFSDYD